MVPFRVWSLAWKVRTTHTDITPFRQQRKHFCCLEKKTEIRSWALKLKQKSSLHEGCLLSPFHHGAKLAPRVKASCGSGFWAELPTAQLSTTSFAAPSPLPHHLAVVPGVPEGSLWRRSRVDSLQILRLYRQAEIRLVAHLPHWPPA